MQARVAITNLGSRRLGSPLSITGEEKAMWEALDVGLHHGFRYIDGTSIFAWTLLPNQCSILLSVALKKKKTTKTLESMFK